jgi:hypothetical protein
LKKFVNKSDISEPKFIMSTSSVPTVSLPEAAGISESSGRTRSRSRSRSRSGSLARHAPPVPPINPLRKRETSRPRAALGSLMGRRGDEPEDGRSMSTTNLPMAGSTSNQNRSDNFDDAKSAFSVSDGEDNGKSDQRRRLRKTSSEAQGLNSRGTAGMGARPRKNSPVFAGPPVSRTVVLAGPTRTPGADLPGGLF